MRNTSSVIIQYICIGLMVVLNSEVKTTPIDNGFVVTSPESTDETEKENRPIIAPPKIYEMTTRTNVSNRFARTQITSKVRNLNNASQETRFSVVLPDSAYITEFIMEIDGKQYKAYIKEKEEAKQIYQEAVDSGWAAGHVEVNARNSNRFTVSVNIQPTSKAIFQLIYEQLLQRHNEQYEIIINLHPGQLVPNLATSIHIHEEYGLRFVRTPPLRTGNEVPKDDDDTRNAHATIQYNEQNTSAVVEFKPDIERQKQLAKSLNGETGDNDGLAGQFIVQYDVVHDNTGGEILLNDGYFVHYFTAGDTTVLKPLPKRVIFVLDTSGSMDGIRIQQLKEAMNSILKELKPNDSFNLVEFNSMVRIWNIDKVEVQWQIGELDPWSVSPVTDTKRQKNEEQIVPDPSPVTTTSVENARKVIEKLNANGGTDIKSALETGLKLSRKTVEDQQNIIIFLTDGEPTVGEVVTDKITSSIREQNVGHVPIFSLSFGDGADRDFLQKISLMNSGFARHIYEAADAVLQLRQFYAEISSPLLSNVTFKYVSNVTRKPTETRFPIIFSGGELIVAGKCDVVAASDFPPPTISGWGIHGPVNFTPKIRHTTKDNWGSLERVWAYLTIRQMLDKRDASSDKNVTDKLSKDALDLALKYSFVTPVSSLVVVKPNGTENNAELEDASNKSPNPFRLQFAAAPSRPFAPALSSNAQSFYLQSMPVNQFMSGLVIAKRGKIVAPPSTTTIRILETEPQSINDDDDVFTDLKSHLTWLQTQTLQINGKSYKLGLDTATSNSSSITCQNPDSSCKLLTECPEIYTKLVDFETFEKSYFCPLQNDEIAGVCCPK